MKNKVQEIIEDYKLIKENDNIVIGVSGGPDSMSLLYVLLEIKKDLNFNIHLAHLNHGVRGEDSDADQVFVERKARELGLAYYTKNVDMVQHGKDRGISAEEAGRELRYGFFREVLESLGQGKIAIAQNKNDQAETLLMRFFRGTGIDGLKGMEYIYGDIIRPILGITRPEIEKYIKDNGIETVLDKTNLMPIYTRNKIRLELIPYIEKEFNPNIVNTLWRTSEISTIDSNFLEKYSKDRYTKIVKKEAKNYIALDGKEFLKEDRSIQQRIIRHSILKVNKTLQGISEIQVTSVLNMYLANETGKEYHLSNNIIAKTSYDNFIIQKYSSKTKKDYLSFLKLEKVNNVDEIGYSFELETFDKGELNTLKESKNIKYFDYDKIHGKLAIRNRKQGDRIVPFGMKGSKKIKDYFIDEKVPREKRDRIPILVDDENILWVVGYRASELYKLTEDTKKVLRVRYEVYDKTREDGNG